MLKTLTINNFRGFQDFSLQSLGRLNLLVGTNNSGKTSVLEAAQLLCSRNPETLREMVRNRGEYFWGDQNRRELDIRHLFYGHEMAIGSEFSISGKVDSEHKLEYVTAAILSENSGMDGESDEIHFKWSYGTEQEWKRRLSYDGGLPEEIRQVKFKKDLKDNKPKTQFVTSSALTAAQMVELFDQIVLTAEEQLVLEALQVVEPGIRRIASVSSERFRNLESKEGFVVLLADNTNRVPIGSMGDGIWRILGLTLSIVAASNGVLLLDEIDTGLHFSTMNDMWKLLMTTARRLNVQVFATTHSNDCWMSLANVAEELETENDEITIQRMEQGKNTGIVFDKDEMIVAANRGIEVR
ncbi:MAG: AAA family ATPase [Spirochaetota bacterium]